MTTVQTLAFALIGECIVAHTLAEETNGAYATYEFIQPRRAKPTFAHFHPTRSETFEILAGTAKYRINGKTRHASAGESFTVPVGAAHVHPWNAGTGELRFVVTFRPQQPNLQELHDIHAGFATLAWLAREGKLNPNQSPKSLLQAARTLHAIMPTVYLAGVPIGLQQRMIGVLARIAARKSYRAFYRYG